MFDEAQIIATKPPGLPKLVLQQLTVAKLSNEQSEDIVGMLLDSQNLLKELDLHACTTIPSLLTKWAQSPKFGAPALEKVVIPFCTLPEVVFAGVHTLEFVWTAAWNGDPTEAMKSICETFPSIKRLRIVARDHIGKCELCKSFRSAVADVIRRGKWLPQLERFDFVPADYFVCGTAIEKACLAKGVAYAVSKFGKANPVQENDEAEEDEDEEENDSDDDDDGDIVVEE